MITSRWYGKKKRLKFKKGRSMVPLFVARFKSGLVELEGIMLD